MPMPEPDKYGSDRGICEQITGQLPEMHHPAKVGRLVVMFGDDVGFQSRLN